MGRTKRGRLLIPSLIALAGAYACGGSAVSNNDTKPAGSGGGAGSAATLPVGPVGDSGNGGDPAVGGIAGAGANSNPAACPSTVPSAGSACPANPAEYRCRYSRPTNCAPIIASCPARGVWNLRLEPDYGDDTCADDLDSVCPDLAPSVGSACRNQGTECEYGPGAITICSVCDTWLAGDDGWNCGAAGAGGEAGYGVP